MYFRWSFTFSTYGLYCLPGSNFAPFEEVKVLVFNSAPLNFSKKSATWRILMDLGWLGLNNTELWVKCEQFRQFVQQSLETVLHLPSKSLNLSDKRKKSYIYIPVLIPAGFSMTGRDWTSSNDWKWCGRWWRPYIPFWCCGRPVKMADRLGEQLLTEV